MNPYIYIIVATVIVSASLAFFIWDRRKMGQRIAQIEGQVGTVVPFWRSIQTVAIEKLTHPHEAAERADELLQLLKDDPLHPMSDEDRAELKRRMETVAAGEDPEIQGKGERQLAKIFDVIMDETQAEAVNPNPVDAVALVGMKKPAETDE